MVIDEVRDMAAQVAAAAQFDAAQSARWPAEPLAKRPSLTAEMPEARSEEPTREALEDAIEQLNRAISLLNHRLNFSVDESTGRLMAEIVNAETNEIIRKVPPERVLEFVRRFREFLGLLFDEQA